MTILEFLAYFLKEDPAERQALHMVSRSITLLERNHLGLEICAVYVSEGCGILRAVTGFTGQLGLNIMNGKGFPTKIAPATFLFPPHSLCLSH